MPSEFFLRRVDKAKARLEQFADPESLKAWLGVGVESVGSLGA